ncbi:DUF4249 domain-containing protein [Gramella lutea]|uniref:DUF4249 domain-containing protein n=1 Tax=Christiangramia lutea TaxID=1607951 RepID=A0A9X1V4M1_9FLAO|nr:DUF4249 domain-containing protein [Christiangramia lutea]MCH4824160.1 DUF4249 domain-containing protein [Christiangramia lutea]
MKKVFPYISIILVFVFISCEEVIQVDLEESEPRLVIEASIIWYKDTNGTEQVIKITETTPFYQEDPAFVENATVKVFSEDGEIFEFAYNRNGEYRNSDFNPDIGLEYELEVNHEEEIYTAMETMVPVTSIDFVEQSESGGFSGEDIEIKAYYTDPVDEENYYLFKFFNEDTSLEFYEDEFTNGNQIFGYYSDEDIEVNDIIEIEMQGISKEYYEYLFILRSQVGSNEGGPFETMPATVKGNIINESNPENYPFGYFRLSEADATTYTVE